MLGRPTVLSDPAPLIMTPLESWPPAERARIRGVLTDIDDTLTTDGALSIEARDALQRLQDAGLPVFAITGRPAGLSEPFALDWLVQAIVAENGAVALWRDANGQLAKDWLQNAATRADHFRRLQAVAQEVLRRYHRPGWPPTALDAKPTSPSTTASSTTCRPPRSRPWWPS